MQNRKLDNTNTGRKKWFGHLQRLPKEAPARKANEEGTKRPVKKLRGGQPTTWHRVIERNLNVINSTSNDAIIKASDRENYQNNIVTRVKSQAIEGLFPETDSESEEDYSSSSAED